MANATAAPRWLMLLVVAAVIAGIAIAFWLYGALTVSG